MPLHLRNWGPYHSKKCLQCSAHLSCYDDLIAHVKDIHSGLWMYVCGKCPELFESPAKRDQHRREAHSQEKKVCPICAESVINLKK